MDDTKIIALYFSRSEKAIACTEEKYGRYCRYIAKNILESNEDAQEVENDTYLSLWNSIPPRHPDSLKGYIGTVCRNISLNRLEKARAKKRNLTSDLVLEELEECIPDHAGQESIGESVALQNALNSFLASLPQKSRIIFLRRYWYNCSVRQISKDLSMRENAVSMSLSRTRKKLREYLCKEGFAL